MSQLWHFTCEHGHAGIGKRGLLRPHQHVLLPELGPIVWLTDEPEPRRDDVGLTSAILTVRHFCSDETLTDLESYGEPDTWWVSHLPLMAELDESWVARPPETSQ